MGEIRLKGEGSSRSIRKTRCRSREASKFTVSTKGADRGEGRASLVPAYSPVLLVVYVLPEREHVLPRAAKVARERILVRVREEVHEVLELPLELGVVALCLSLPASS